MNRVIVIEKKFDKEGLNVKILQCFKQLLTT